VSRSIDVISVEDFANLIDVLLVCQSFLFWNQISYFKDHVYSSLIVEMKSERCPFWNIYFENQAFWSKTQHTLFKIWSLLIVLYIENRNWLVVRLKWFFPWFFVSILNSDFRYIFWWSMMRWPFYEFQKQNAQVKTQGFIKKGCFFWAPILSACIITSSLIHETTTLMAKLFKFWERHLSVQTACLIKKVF
jgi:hypothetical protein